MGENGRINGHGPVEEKKHLDGILEMIQTEVERLNVHLEQKQQDIVRMKKYFWENCNEFDEFGYEDYTNRQMIQNELNEAENRLRKRQSLERLQKSPYFSCVDFKYKDEKDVASYYIGMAAFSPHRSFLPVVFDWRAPVAALFYDYDKGEAEYESPQGSMKGEIVHKLQYKIKNGELEYYFENDMKIDDEVLKRELGMKGSTSLKSIVATIQREQNAVIRNQNDKILVVQGSAGSGKTSVALHRIAYLLYHRRSELNADNVMILSPNAVFSDYISRILPELGEEPITEMSFDRFAERELQGVAAFETRYHQLEYLLTADGQSEHLRKRREEIVYKRSREFLNEMYGYVLELESDIVNFLDLSFRNIERTENELTTMFYEKFPDVPVLQRLDTIADYIIAEEEALSNQDMDPIKSSLLKEKLNRMYRTKSVRTLYYEFLRGLNVEAGRENGLGNDEMIPYEDVFPLIYMKYLLCGIGNRREMKHVVIDEMQDYSGVQYAILAKLFYCPMTILGDREQEAGTEKSTVEADIYAAFGKAVRTITLNKSYRSTHEISTFSSRFVDVNPTEYLERHGRDVLIHECKSAEEQTSQLIAAIEQQADYETIAVICKSQIEAERWFSSLKGKVETICLFSSSSNVFNAGVIVTPFYLAKGLEFDCVHIPDCNDHNYCDPIHRRALYISCTRGLHELDLYYNGYKSRFLSEHGKCH